MDWDFESGDDALDTYWGERAYEYYSLHPGENVIEIEIEMIAQQITT